MSRLRQLRLRSRVAIGVLATLLLVALSHYLWTHPGYADDIQAIFAPVGRYQIVHLGGQAVVRLDTKSGEMRIYEATKMAPGRAAMIPMD